VTKLIIDQSQCGAFPTVAQNLDLCHRGVCPTIAESSDLCHVVFTNRLIRSTRTAVESVPHGDTNRTIFFIQYANLPARLLTRGPISVIDLSRPVIDRWQHPGRESGPLNLDTWCSPVCRSGPSDVGHVIVIEQLI
jgi:hypothetical protein